MSDQQLFIVTTDEGTIEVPADALTPPDGWRVMPQDRLNQMDMRAKAAARRALAKDEGFRLQMASELAQKAGIGLDDEGNFVLPEAQGVDEDAIKERVTERLTRQYQGEIETREQRITQLTGTLDQMYGLQRSNEVMLKAREYGVKPQYLSEVGKTGRTLWQNMVEPMLARDETTGKWGVKEGDGFAPPVRPDNPHDIADIEDMYLMLKKDPGFRHFFEDEGQSVANPGRPGGRNGQKILTRKAFEALPPHKQSEFFASGGQVVD